MARKTVSIAFDVLRNMNQSCTQVKMNVRRKPGAVKTVFWRPLVLALPILLVWFGGCARKADEASKATPHSSVVVIAPARNESRWIIRTKSAEFHILGARSAKAFLLQNGKTLTIQADADDDHSETAIVNGKSVEDFVSSSAPRVMDASGRLGALGKRIEFLSTSASTKLERLDAIEVYDDFPNFAILSTSFKNASDSDLKLDKVIAQRHSLDASLADAKAKPYQMWSFQGASVNWGNDEILPIPAKFAQENLMAAPVNHGQGGGIPVNAFWTRTVGVAMGHIETLPLVLTMPVRVGSEQRVEAAVELNDSSTLKPGESFATPRTFLAVYAGDFYEPLRMYSLALQKEGWTLPKPNNEDYGVAWCGWGYESDVTPKQMLGTIPKLKELGIRWATLDDRWFDTYGDWNPRKDTFPGDSLQNMVKEFHRQGLRAQIWWYPLVAENGSGGYESHKYVVSDVVKEHPDWLILDQDGKPARSTRGLATLCPALPEVQDYTKHLVEKFIRDWDFDGHKLDNIFSVPACYNPKHHHKSPQDSIQAMAEVYKVIFQTTRALKPESVTQICPCGTTPNFAWLQYLDQAVTADPVGGVQVRRRIKWYKALLGPQAAVYGDHVELSEMTRVGKGDWKEHGRDFASTLGTGGVLGTKFTWGDNNPKYKAVALTASKEAQWKKWISLYNDKMLSRGEFRDLYVYGYDDPEGYAIEKDGTMYYGFFTKDPTTPYRGAIELRGLQPGKYRVTDYVDEKDLGTIDSENPRLTTSFTGHLLVQATKQP
jgi:alpha-galactosidase